jgi:transposase
VHVITHVETTPAHIQDIEQTATIHAALAAKGLLPNQHFVDAGYIDAELLVTSLQAYGVELIGPIKADPSWQAKDPEAYDAAHFTIDWANHTVTCPQGHTSKAWTEHEDAWHNAAMTVNFPKPICRDCPVRARCTRSPTYPRSLTLHPQAQQEALQQRRIQQTTESWWHHYHTRAGVEGTISQAVLAVGLRQTRYRGLAKTRFQHIASAVAINLKRLFAWVNEVPHAKTRTSRFAALKPHAA